ncbi:hypothetical protein HRG_010364 [Hirsutella rhossiliensis]|uniref:Ras guanyl-nucleotide exchange factor n=1 Tax=Hirsutella rhossiliensis TaxID=111463 RepID=A0A9P8MT23_9HYPO|nr:uncharacterized protein HRG_10364 [Hirsutella rhossiliensis]KAH0958677.1 hypothetical protein HRG_10364 [Hirsutella rhossiliensis]
MPAPPSTPAHLRALYRALLRELPARPTAGTSSPLHSTSRSPLHARIRAPFAAGNISNGAAEAEQLVTYLRSQRQYVTLLERYNPGMDMDEEERVRLSARRVGMEMPVLHRPGGGNE